MIQGSFGSPQPNEPKMKEEGNGILDLKWDSCRYILNEDTSNPRFCCVKVKKRPYCKEHADRCFLKPKKETKR